MVVAGFILAKSASEDGRHCCQLEMSDEAGSSVFVRMLKVLPTHARVSG